MFFEALTGGKYPRRPRRPRLGGRAPARRRVQPAPDRQPFGSFFRFSSERNIAYPKSCFLKIRLKPSFARLGRRGRLPLRELRRPLRESGTGDDFVGGGGEAEGGSAIVIGF